MSLRAVIDQEKDKNRVIQEQFQKEQKEKAKLETRIGELEKQLEVHSITRGSRFRASCCAAAHDALWQEVDEDDVSRNQDVSEKAKMVEKLEQEKAELEVKLMVMRRKDEAKMQELLRKDEELKELRKKVRGLLAGWDVARKSPSYLPGLNCVNGLVLS